MENNILDQIPDCIIDANGVFKYIQINVTDTKSNVSKIVLRGSNKYKFHADNFDAFTNELISLGLALKTTCFCPGGGRLDIKKDKKHILIYGYSQSYGQCDHQISSKIIIKNFPDYKIECSNDGY